MMLEVKCSLFTDGSRQATYDVAGLEIRMVRKVLVAMGGFEPPTPSL